MILDGTADSKLIIHRRTMKKMRLKTSSMKGLQGERFAKVQQDKVRIPSFTKTAKYRIPDILTDAALIEVKNVKRQGFSNQFKDFLIFCKSTNRKFIVCIRDDAKFSPRLKKMVQDGEMEIWNLGYFFTQEAQEKIKAALLPSMEKACRSYLEKKKIRTEFGK